MQCASLSLTFDKLKSYRFAEELCATSVEELKHIGLAAPEIRRVRAASLKSVVLVAAKRLGADLNPEKYGLFVDRKKILSFLITC